MAHHQLKEGTPLYYIDKGAGRPLVLFDGSSHAPFWEEPEKFNRSLLAVANSGQRA